MIDPMIKRACLLSSLLLMTSACDRSGSSSPADAGPTTVAANEPAEPSQTPSTPEEICAHARERTRELGQLDVEAANRDAPDDQKQEARARGDEIVQAVYDGFAPVCLELSGPALDCMMNIDDYVDPLVAARQANIDCRDKGGDSQACWDEWSPQIDAAQEHPCHEAVQMTLDAAYYRGTGR